MSLLRRRLDDELLLYALSHNPSTDALPTLVERFRVIKHRGRVVVDHSSLKVKVIRWCLATGYRLINRKRLAVVTRELDG